MNAKSIVVFTGSVLLGFGAGWWVSARTKTPLIEENRSLRASWEEAQRTESKTKAQRDRWEAESERLRQQADEIHPLRAEVTRLRTELAEKSAIQARVAKEPNKSEARSVEEAAQLAKAQLAKKGLATEASIPLENAPAAVSAAILREMLAAPPNGLFTHVRNGKTVYGTKGQLPDGRGIALTVNEDGSLLEKWSEVPADTLPSNVQEVVSQKFGDLAIGRATEVMENQRIRYELSAKNEGSSLQVTVGGDGTLLGYSARFGAPRDEKVKK